MRTSDAVLVLDVATGKELRRFDGRPRLSLDGRVLGRSEADTMVRLWDAATGNVLGRLVKAQEHLVRFACSPDGKALAPAHESEKITTVQLWEVATDRVRQEFRGHQGAITAVAFSPDGKTLASGSRDTTLLLWDVTRGNRAPAGELSARELQALWTDLGKDDAVKAYAAVCTMAGSPRQTVPFLKERLPPAAPVEAKQVARLIADLDNERFEVRERATADLEKLGELAEPVLRQTLAGQPSPETRRRLRLLVEKLEGPIASTNQLQALRAVETLERIGGAQALTLLRELAKGTPDARLTREASASRKRLVQVR